MQVTLEKMYINEQSKNAENISIFSDEYLQKSARNNQN